MRHNMGHHCLCRYLFVLFVLIFSIYAQEQTKPVIQIKNNKNVTVLVMTKYTIACRVAGNPMPTVSWEKAQTSGHFIPLINLGSNFKILRSNALRFYKISLKDAGRYRCRASNNLGTVYSKNITITVQAPVEIIDHFLWPQHVPYGSNNTIACMAVGIPTPKIIWLKNGVEITAAINTTRLHFIAREKTDFECIASNAAKGGTTVSKKASIDVTGMPVGTCTMYTGSICEPYLSNTSIFIPTSSNLTTQERHIKQIRESLINNIHDRKCHSSVFKMLCHYVFPKCSTSGLTTELPNPICRETCQVVSRVMCGRSSVGDVLQSTYTNCSLLPSVDNRSARCQDLNIDRDIVTTECYKDRGQFYNGTLNVTASGQECLRWNSNIPLLHPYVSVNRQENYCRNIHLQQDKPWCYTEAKTWETCDVPKCDDPHIDTQKMEIYPQNNSSETVSITVGVACAFGVILAAAFGYIIFRRKVNQRFQKMKYVATPVELAEELNIDITKLQTNECYNKAHEILEYERRWEKFEYPRNDIVHVSDLGEGAFGKIFLAECPDLNSANQMNQAAVRVLRSDATDDALEDFEEEMLLLSQLAHPNILSLLGVCSIGKPMCAIVEYMTHGELDAYLRTHSNTILSCDESSRALTTFEQLEIAKQIASAMEYFSGRGFVHRDLASRNCLIGGNLRVKLSDFGLARSMTGMGYYKGNEEEPIAVRWMSPEVILHNIFSVDSDTYSYGIFLWEIFSCGSQPYAGLSTDNVVLKIRDGNLLARFTNTSEELYLLMCRCWSRMPAGRPGFAEIYKSLCKIQMSLEH